MFKLIIKTMLKINENNRIDAKDIYSFVEVKTDFYHWIKRCIEQADLQIEKDFTSNLSESTGGRRSINYEFTIDAAKEICIVSATSKAKELRRWLIGLSNQVDTGVLVTHEQVIEVIRMIKVFAICEYRKKALNENAENFIKNVLEIHPEYMKNKGLLYGKFHAWRNEMLHTGKEELNERLKEYCLIENKRIPAKFTQDEAIVMMGEYGHITNAIWDNLSSKNKSQELINNICSLAEKLAHEIKPFCERLNQSNLFFNKIETNEVKKVLK